MIPFPGESLAVDHTADATGAPIMGLNSLTYRDNDVATFHAGDGIRAVVFFGPNYLESADTPGVVSWCIEVYGGSGTLTLTECLGDGTPDTLLGSFPVTAGDTLAVDSTQITVADVFTLMYGSLRVECTAGTVVVQQVKLRVWPVGGPVGGWSGPYPAWTLNDRLPDVRGVEKDATYSTGSGGPRDIDAAWFDISTILPTSDEPYDVTLSDLPPTPPTGGVSGGARVTIAASSGVSPPPGEWGVSFSAFLSAALAMRSEPIATVNPADGLVDGVDYITAPTEVYGDPAGIVQAGDAATNHWNETGVRWEQNGGNYDDDYDPLIVAVPWTEYTHPDGTPYILYPEVEAGSVTSLFVPDVDLVLFAPSHQWFRARPTRPYVADDLTYSVNVSNGHRWQLGLGDYNPEGVNAYPLTYRTDMPPYLVWSPSEVQPLRLMQRGDGLGMGSGRLLGLGTRQASTRLFGSL